MFKFRPFTAPLSLSAPRFPRHQKELIFRHRLPLRQELLHHRTHDLQPQPPHKRLTSPHREQRRLDQTPHKRRREPLHVAPLLVHPLLRHVVIARHPHQHHHAARPQRGHEPAHHGRERRVRQLHLREDDEHAVEALRRRVVLRHGHLGEGARGHGAPREGDHLAGEVDPRDVHAGGGEGPRDGHAGAAAGVEDVCVGGQERDGVLDGGEEGGVGAVGGLVGWADGVPEGFGFGGFHCEERGFK